MNLKLILGLLALVGIASAVPLGPYSIDYDQIDGAIWTPIAQVQEFTADDVNATAYAGVILAPDGWALVIVNDFEEEVGLTEIDAWAPFRGQYRTVTMSAVAGGGEEAKYASDGQNWRAVWTLDGGWEDGILYGSDTVAVTTGGWGREEVLAFLGSISISSAA